MRGFVTAKEFADRLEITMRQFERMIDAGQIPQPMPRVAGGKRIWTETVVKKIEQGEAA